MTESRPSRSPFCLAVVVILLAAVPVTAQIQDSFVSARELYASAAYEEALAMLNRLRASTGSLSPERGVEQYRALCLLALGRAAEAQRAIEIVVAAAPSFQPTEADASPRVRTAFSDVRRRMLPGIIQQDYAQAKTAFERKEFAVSAEGFTRVIEMLGDPDVGAAASQPPLADLRTLAAGFRDLSVGATAPPLLVAAKTVPAAPPPPPPVVPATPRAPKIYGAEDGNVVPPAVIRQALPAFTTRTLAALQGTLAVVVSETGVVESAAMLASVSPLYDRLILEAAIQWRYKPATLDGMPVKFRRVVQIKVAPTR